MPSQKLTPTFCMEDMDMDTLDMPDTMDIPMEDIPTLDKLLPLISKWTANHPWNAWRIWIWTPWICRT